MLTGVVEARLVFAIAVAMNCGADHPPNVDPMPAPTKRAPAKHAAKSAAGARLGALPEWNLADLYAGIDDPKVKRDLDRADQYAVAFEEDFTGKLASLAERPAAGRALAE